MTRRLPLFAGERVTSYRLWADAHPINAGRPGVLVGLLLAHPNRCRNGREGTMASQDAAFLMELREHAIVNIACITHTTNPRTPR